MNKKEFLTSTNWNAEEWDIVSPEITKHFENCTGSMNNMFPIHGNNPFEKNSKICRISWLLKQEKPDLYPGNVIEEKPQQVNVEEFQICMKGKATGEFCETQCETCKEEEFPEKPDAVQEVNLENLKKQTIDKMEIPKEESTIAERIHEKAKTAPIPVPGGFVNPQETIDFLCGNKDNPAIDKQCTEQCDYCSKADAKGMTIQEYQNFERKELDANNLKRINAFKELGWKETETHIENGTFKIELVALYKMTDEEFNKALNFYIQKLEENKVQLDLTVEAEKAENIEVKEPEVVAPIKEEVLETKSKEKATTSVGMDILQTSSLDEKREKAKDKIETKISKPEKKVPLTFAPEELVDELEIVDRIISVAERFKKESYQLHRIKDIIQSDLSPSDKVKEIEKLIQNL